MRPPLLRLLLLSVLVVPVAAKEPLDANWPSFRGRDARGVAEGYPLPASWSGTTGQGVRWKTPIPGLGHSCPSIWGDRLYVTTAVSGKADPQLKIGLYGDGDSAVDDTAHRFVLYCLDRNTGRILWERVASSGVPKVKRHPKATHANPTVATDGKHVLAFFGSEGLYCYDPAGKLLWSKDFGVLESGPSDFPHLQWGFASSPVIDGEKVLVQCDVQKGSFLAAYDVRDGRELWRTPRDDVPTWGTPAVVKEGGREQVVVNGYRHIGGYDLKTGKELWRLKGGGDIPVPTPIFAHGLIFITNAHGRLSPVYAVRPSATGDITLPETETSSPNIAWSQPRDGCYLQTPLVYGDYLYVCRSNGVLGCYEAKTGKRLYQERLGSGATGFTASAVGGNGKVYFTSEEGEVYVLQAGPAFKVLATNPLGEICLATPAISRGTLYFRTRGHVLAVGPP